MSKKKPETTTPQNDTKKKKKKHVINTMSDIKSRTEGLNPLSTVGISAMTFPDKISTVRSNMAARHTSQYVVLTNPEFPRVYTGAEDPFGMRSSWNVTCQHDYELVRKFVKFKFICASRIFSHCLCNHLCHFITCNVSAAKKSSVAVAFDNAICRKFCY